MANNNLLEKIILPIADKLMNTTFIKELHEWRNVIGKMNEDELQQLQKKRLQDLLQQTIKNIPFYRNQNILLSEDPYESIKQFPVMYKKLMKENMDSLLIYDKSKMVLEQSSGSSGIQGEVYMTTQESRLQQAVQTFLWEWSGYKIGEPLLQNGVTLKRGLLKSIKDKLFNTLYISAYELEYNKIVADLKKAKQKGCKYFGGYAASLNVYAQTAIKAEIDIQFDGVISWGDKLFDHYKANIEKAFGNPVITELYGATEGFVISGTCNLGHHHQLTPQTYIELLDKDGNDVKPGELGYVVATRLDAQSFPLIRYYLGDLAIRENDNIKCSCGRHFPLLRKIIGRDTDVVKTPLDKTLIVHFFTGIFEHISQIKQFRVIQRIKEGIEIEYIPDRDFSVSALEKASYEIYKKANERFPIQFRPVDFIPSTISGKPQIIQSFIAEKLKS